jgi:signal transduction histidine kinase
VTQSNFQQPPGRSPRHTVLIVDDDRMTVGVIAELLEMEGFEVWQAFSAAEARTLLENRQPELLLLDVRLPDADGRDVCAALKADPRFEKVFVILISGMEIGVQSRVSGLNQGADEYLTKPIQSVELIARLRSFLRIREAGEALRRANEQLEERVLERTEELRQANSSLEQASAELRTFNRRLLETQESERRRLAHELHDEAGQALTVLKFSFDHLDSLVQGEASEALADGRASLTRLTQLIRNLWQVMLSDFGLVPAIVWYCQRYTTSTRIKVNFEHEGTDGQRFHPEIETAAYRTVQESLTNVARHAKVTEVRVLVWSGSGLLHVQISDQGQGFDPRAGLSRNGSCGLVGMQERVRLLNGTWSLTSRPGTGTRVIAEFPIADASPAPLAVGAASNGSSTLDTKFLRPSDFAKSITA